MIKYDLHGVSEDLLKLINGEAVEVEIPKSEEYRADAEMPKDKVRNIFSTSSTKIFIIS